MRRVVLDTNVFVSALNWPLGKPRKIYDRWLSGEFQLITSTEILSELMRILRDEFGWLDEEAYEVYNLIGQIAEVVRPEKEIKAVKEDPQDNKFLECAVISGAKHIVTGDGHLLKIGRFKDIEIILPDRFLKSLAEESS